MTKMADVGMCLEPKCLSSTYLSCLQLNKRISWRRRDLGTRQTLMGTSYRVLISFYTWVFSLHCLLIWDFGQYSLPMKKPSYSTLSYKFTVHQPLSGCGHCPWHWGMASHSSNLHTFLVTFKRMGDERRQRADDREMLGLCGISLWLNMRVLACVKLPPSQS